MIELFHPIKLTKVAENILHTKFFTQEFCTTILEIVKERTEWKRNIHDKHYSTEDLFFSNIAELHDLDFLIKDYCENELFPRLLKFWLLDEIKISQLFVVKYDLTRQKKLALHCDDSFITCSIKLNQNYSGGTLMFPFQNFSNETVPVGDILIWPSKITHPHKSTELLSGEKYSITIWTDEKLKNNKNNS